MEPPDSTRGRPPLGRRPFFAAASRALVAAFAYPWLPRLVRAQPDAAAAAAALEASFEPFLGRYEAVDLGQHASTIDRAILEGTEAMGPLRRSVGRRRLHAVNRPVRVLRIVREGARLVTEFDGDRYVAPLSGAVQRGRDPEGEIVRISYRVAGDTLRARYVGDDGEKRIGFQLAGGNLRMGVTLSSDQLPGPIRYQLAYRRA